MTLNQFLAVLRARFWLAGAIFLTTVACAIGASLLLPKKYSASALLILDQSKPDPLAVNAVWSPSTPAAYLSTQIDIIKSDRVALDVVKQLRLTESPEARAKWMEATAGRGRLEVWLAHALLKMLDVSPSRDSNVLAITAGGSDPQFVMAVANAFARSYIDTSIKVRVDPARDFSSFFDEQSNALRLKLESAQARLSEFQREKGIVVDDDKMDNEVARLNELSSQLSALRAVVSESGSRQAFAQGDGADRVQEVVGNPNLASLRAELTRAEARLQELSARMDENHPQVQEAKASIAVLRDRLSLETRRVTGGLAVTNAINRQRETELRGSVEAQRLRVLSLKSVRDQGQALLRDVEGARRAFEGVQARLHQSSLESHVTQSSAYLLAEATEPLVPLSPKLAVNAGLSVVVGLMLALGSMVALEFIDLRVRTPESASTLLGVPLLGVLPRPGSKGHFAHRRIPLVQARLLGRMAGSRRG
jgi:chain length determinant protein EpsF